MRDLYRRYFSACRPPVTAAPEPEETALEAQVRAAFPCPPVSDTLQARVADLCRAAAAPDSQRRSLAARNRKRWIYAAAWGTLGLAIAAGIIIPTLPGARERASRRAGLPSYVAALPGPGPSESWGEGVAVPRSPASSLRAGSAVARAPRHAGPDDDATVSAGRPAGPRPAREPEPARRPAAAPPASQPDRYLIRNATLTLEVRDARQAARALTAAVRGAGGYVSDSHDTVDDLGQRSAEITVRVPAGRFDGSLARIEALGKVMEKQVTAEDVTEEFVDSQARLRNLQETEQRLRDHLGHAGRLPDILLVERELTRVRGQIEQLQGRLRYLQHRIAYSTLDVTLSEAPRPQSVVPPAGYSGRKVAADAMRALVAFGQALWSGAIWLAVWAIVWLPVSAMGWVAVRRRT